MLPHDAGFTRHNVIRPILGLQELAHHNRTGITQNPEPVRTVGACIFKQLCVTVYRITVTKINHIPYSCITIYRQADHTHIISTTESTHTFRRILVLFRIIQMTQISSISTERLHDFPANTADLIKYGRCLIRCLHTVKHNHDMIMRLLNTAIRIDILIMKRGDKCRDKLLR